MALTVNILFSYTAGRILDSCIIPRQEAFDILSKTPFFGAWDPEVLKLYVECGTTPSRDSDGKPIIRLKMPGVQEAIVFSETHTEREVFQRLRELDERIALRWIMPGHPDASE